MSLFHICLIKVTNKPLVGTYYRMYVNVPCCVTRINQSINCTTGRSPEVIKILLSRGVSGADVDRLAHLCHQIQTLHATFAEGRRLFGKIEGTLAERLLKEPRPPIR